MRKINWKRALKDAAISAGVLTASTIVTGLLSRVNNDNNPFAASMFILAVAIIARLTDGYVWGVLSSLAAVFLVNIIFSHPFGAFSLSMPSYPLTFAAMLIVSLLVSALTSQIKRQQVIRIEAEKEKMRANLLRAIAHDIRTPLTSIMGASSTLVENGDIPREERDELLGEIARDAGWLVRVTENLLTVTKVSGDGAALRKEEEAVEEIVMSSVLKFRRNFPDVPVHIDQPEDMLLCPMDAVLIEQVLINLMENAVIHGKHTTHVDLKVREEASAVRFVVEDDGDGIDAAILPRMFEGYIHENDAGNGENRRNMGIGLSVCQAIVRAHGGKIHACNKKEGGALLSFTLPIEGDNE